MSRQDPAALRRRLNALAARQSGYFTAAQALEIGYSYQSQKYHADRGNWERVARGIYRLPEWPAGSHDDLVRWTLWSDGKGVVSHETALVVHDLGDVDPARVHMTVPSSFSRKAPPLSLHVAELGDEDVQTNDGFVVTTPLRSLLDVAAQRSTTPEVLATAIRDALERGLVTRRMLRERADALGDRCALNVERALQELEA